MFAEETVDGAGSSSLNSRRSSGSMSRQFADKQLWTVNQDDSNRSTSLRTTNLQTASSSSSSDDKSAGKLAMDDDLSIGEGKIKRSTATSGHGVISLMGRRREMEDAVTAVPSLLQTLGSAFPHSFFAVYDGHGGFGVAEKCKQRLHHLVAEEIEVEIGGVDLPMDEVEVGARVDWERVMKLSFARMDREVCGEVGEGLAGDMRVEEKTTAVVAVVGIEEIVVANCGDSRAVLCRGGVAIPLSRDYKPQRPDERERVEAAGGSVVDWYGPRILGVLDTSSQSIGDHCMRPYLISIPDVTVYQRTQSDEFLILASDGLWDVVSNDMACELVKRILLHEQSRRREMSTEEDNYAEGYANHVATMLAEMAISRGSKDNVSVTVVMLC